jgi:integral membrane protein (TIGR00529 family)
MSVLGYIPATIKVLLIFLAVIVAIRRKFSLGNAFMAGALLLGLIFSLPPKAMLISMWASVIYPKTLCLAVIVSLILVLSSTMEIAGQMKRLLTNFQGLISSPLFNLSIFPALIGLLPMPGGAVFSAPMVKELGERTGLAADKLSFINYWYRHLWEYWWPLYPGVLLSTALADLNLWTFVITMLPLTLVAIGVGYLPIGKIRRPSEKDRNAAGRPPLKPLFKELTPIITVIALGLGLGMLLSYLFPAFEIGRETGLIAALGITIGSLWYENRMSRTRIVELLSDRNLLGMMYMVIAILVFKGMLEDSRAVEMISREFRSLDIPLMLLAVTLPFLVGAVAGITIAFVGSTFPILILLIKSFGQSQFMMAYMMLAMTSGLIGVFVSPLHLCLLLTNQYFGTSLSDSYKLLWLPCLLLLIFGLGFFWFLNVLAVG